MYSFFVRKLSLFIMCYVPFMLTCQANSQELKAINTQVINAIQLLKNKQYAQACVKLKLLPEIELKAPDLKQKQQTQLNIYYLRGQCYAGIGLLEKAEGYFKKVVDADSGQARPYMDLALVYLYLGKFSLAEQQYEKVLSINNLSPELRNKIKNIAASNPKKIDYYVELTAGLLSDSNTINAAQDDEIIIFDRTFVFNKSERPIQSQGVYLGGKFRVNKLLSSGRSLTGKLSLSSSTFSGQSDGNSLIIDAKGSYNIKHHGGEYSIEPRLASISLGGSPLLNILGVNLRYSTLINNNLRITPKIGLNNYAYSADTGNSAQIIAPEVKLHYQALPELLVFINLGFKLAAADSDEHSYTGITTGIGANYLFNDNAILSASVDYLSASYDKEIIGFGLVRSDQRLAINSNLSYNLKGFSLPQVTLDMGVNLFSNSSNISLYETSRTQLYMLGKYTF